MKSPRLLWSVAALINGICWTCISSLPAEALESAPGITISPAIVQLSLPQSAANFSTTAYLANNTNETATIALSAVNFTQTNGTGGLAFLGTNVSQTLRAHELASGIQITPETLTLPPNSHRSFQINLVRINQLQPGGHYAAVLARVTNEASLSATTDHVAINQVLSMIVFAATAYGGTQSISLAKPDLGIAWFHLPTQINLLFKGTGNTETVPRGDITLYSPSQRPLARTTVNAGSGLVLPGAAVLFKTSLGHLKQPLLPGIYSVRVAYTHDAVSSVYYYDLDVLYVGAPIFYALGAILAGLLIWAGFRRKKATKYSIHS